MTLTLTSRKHGNLSHLYQLSHIQPYRATGVAVDSSLSFTHVHAQTCTFCTSTVFLWVYTYNCRFIWMSFFTLTVTLVRQIHRVRFFFDCDFFLSFFFLIHFCFSHTFLFLSHFFLSHHRPSLVCSFCLLSSAGDNLWLWVSAPPVWGLMSFNPHILYINTYNFHTDSIDMIESIQDLQ